jgi:long-chain acyl-CoA synthetase
MKGYYRNPEATQKVLIDGWLHTGDIGKIDKDGFLFITGRIKDLIVTSSGNKVAPDTIEVKLLGTPELKEYAVVGMTMKEDLGEQIVLAAVPNNDVKLPTETDDDFLRRVATIIEQKTAELPSYAHISYIYFVDTLPKTTTLKVKRRDLKQILKTLKPFVTSDKEHSTFFDEDEEYQSINTQVIDLIQQHKNKEYINITPRSSLQFDLNVDSLDRVALKDILENHFNCHISDDRMFKAERVEDLAHLVIMDSEYDKINEVEVKERSSKISKILARGWLYLLKKLWKIEVIGKENIPKTGSFILAANHTSHLDAYWVLSILEPEQRRNTFTFAKKEHFESSSTRLLVEMINSIPIDRTGNFTFALNEGLDKLKIGCNLLIFPEGTRSKDGSLGTLRLGTAHLALRSLVPIIPIYISGGSDIYSTHDSFPRLFDFKNMGRRKVTIVIGKPIQPILKPNLKENAECITKTLESEIIKNARLVA